MARRATHISPIPKPADEGRMNFLDAFRQMFLGKKITRLEWKNSKIYGYLNAVNGHVSIVLENGISHDWIITDGDYLGMDWIIIPEEEKKEEVNAR